MTPGHEVCVTAVHMTPAQEVCGTAVVAHPGSYPDPPPFLFSGGVASQTEKLHPTTTLTLLGNILFVTFLETHGFIMYVM